MIEKNNTNQYISINDKSVFNTIFCLQVFLMEIKICLMTLLTVIKFVSHTEISSELEAAPVGSASLLQQNFTKKRKKTSFQALDRWNDTTLALYFINSQTSENMLLRWLFFLR